MTTTADFSNFTRIPSLPTIAVEALKIFHTPDSTNDQLATVIRKDPAIVTRLLKAVNSARYGLSKEIVDLNHAISIMGRQSAAPLILSFSLAQQSMDDSEFQEIYRHFWLRSFMQATAAEIISNRLGNASFRGECYTTSLLAGIGKLAMLKVQPDKYLECMQRSVEHGIPVTQIEQETFGFSHHKLSSILLEQLGLPQRCHLAIQAFAEGGHGDDVSETSALVEVTKVADAVAGLLCDKTPAIALIHLEESLSAMPSLTNITATQLLETVMSVCSEFSELFDISPPKLPSATDLLQDALEQLGRMATMAADPANVKLVPAELMEENGRLKRRVADLLHVSRVDTLTGLCNRAYLLQELAERAALHRVRGLSLGMALVDIDHFKTINDTYGHQAGDEALKVVALSLQDSMRDSDLVGRWGGEEFVILLKDANAAGLAVVGERIRSRIQNTVVEFEGKRISVTVSIGLVYGHVAGKEQDFGEQLFAAADAAMYRAKKSGRNCFVVSSLSINNDGQQTGGTIQSSSASVPVVAETVA